jgi:anti-anti-sigma regulatory factor
MEWEGRGHVCYITNLSEEVHQILDETGKLLVLDNTIAVLIRLLRESDCPDQN